MSTMPLLVLAGGFGTRLRDAVQGLPKPLAPIAGKPMLEHLIINWQRQGIRSFIFLLHYQADLIEDFLFSAAMQAQMRDCEVRVVREPEPLGTGGAVAHALQKNALQGQFMLANADTWLSEGVQALQGCTPPAIAAVWVEDTSRYGAISIEGNKVVRFQEKSQHAQSGWINAGLYLLDAEALSALRCVPFSLESAWLQPQAEKGSLACCQLNTTFIDIGIPADYYRFNVWMASGMRGGV